MNTKNDDEIDGDDIIFNCKTANYFFNQINCPENKKENLLNLKNQKIFKTKPVKKDCLNTSESSTSYTPIDLILKDNDQNLNNIEITRSSNPRISASNSLITDGINKPNIYGDSSTDSENLNLNPLCFNFSNSSSFEN